MLNRRGFLTFGLHVVAVAIGVLCFLAYYKVNNNVLSIIEHPDPSLRKISEPIDHIDDDIISLADDIAATLRYRAMVDFFTKRSVPRGLAAPQVGVFKKLVVCGINGELKVLINPKILERKGTYSGYDDCMSVHKGDNRVIKRAAYVKLKYRDLDYRERILVARNRVAALLQHEIDHLDGVLNIDSWGKEEVHSSRVSFQLTSN